MAMDQLDRDLLGLLTQDARASATDLAARLGVSRATVQNRIGRLCDSGAIARFTIEAGAQGQDATISAFTLIKIRPGDTRPFVAALRKMPEITDIHSLSGSFDYMIESRTLSVGKLDTLLDQVRSLPAVAQTETSIRLARLR